MTQEQHTLPREEYLHRLRHSAAHLLAQAVQELFPDTRLTIGPPTEDGFYYDFDTPHRFTPEDLTRIENRMRRNLKHPHPFVGEEMSREAARRFWAERGERFKVEIIDDLPPEEAITLYRHGDFVDLCRGGHLESTRDIKHFKLTKSAGAYWRGDEARERLQRIYGTVWPTEEELKDHLHRLEEAKKRDHRELGPRLGLFSIHPEETGSGLILWHPKGALMRHLIEGYLKDLHLANGYHLAVTPHVGLSALWRRSGHLDFYQENMFPEMKLENQSYFVKPMTCPFHITMYKTGLHSYRELPIRLYETAAVYRFERSGVLHGMLRVRGFTQDDAHVFCTFDQLHQEIAAILTLARRILEDFRFRDYEVKLSTRPEKFVGDPARWDEAEAILAAALKDAGFAFEVDPGEGVFYGPKIDLKIKDSLGRKWQCTTVQVDFNLPERFDATYRNDQGKDVPVCMVHRAILGSLERFFGILVEHFAGAFPLWIAPVQAAVLTISERFTAYGAQVTEALKAEGVRVEARGQDEKIGAKIRAATLEKIPYLLIVGEKEEAAGAVAVRTRAGVDLGAMPLAAFTALLREDVAHQRGASGEPAI